MNTSDLSPDEVRKHHERLVQMIASVACSNAAVVGSVAPDAVFNLHVAADGEDLTACVLVVSGRGLSKIVRDHLTAFLASDDFIDAAKKCEMENSETGLPPFTGDQSLN